MKKVLKIILLIALAGLVMGTFVFLYFKSQPKKDVFELVKAHYGTITTKTVATGKISPRYEILIKPQISGIVAELHKKEGDLVKKGDIIATVKVIPEMASLNSAESRVRVAEINLKQVTQMHNRQTQLFTSGVIAKEEMEKSESEFSRAKEELENAQDNLDIIRNGISKKSAQLSNTQIRSTIDGMILSIPIKVGNSVIQSNTFNDGTTIASVANMNDMIFVGKVDETEVGKVHQGMIIDLTIGALENLRFKAFLEYISPKGTEENGAILFEIKAAATIPDSVFVRAGYSANAEIVIAKAENVLLIPEGSIRFVNDTAFVDILKDKNTPIQEFKSQVVRTGLSDGIHIEIKSGIDTTQQIKGILLNNIKLQDKAKP